MNICVLSKGFILQTNYHSVELVCSCLLFHCIGRAYSKERVASLGQKSGSFKFYLDYTWILFYLSFLLAKHFLFFWGFCSFSNFLFWFSGLQNLLGDVKTKNKVLRFNSWFCSFLFDLGWHNWLFNFSVSSSDNWDHNNTNT